MAVIRLTPSGGEMPRVPARQLPAGAAQINQNLLATAVDFRPVKGSLSVATATNFVSTVTNAKTLFRRLRGADGQLRTDDSTGWWANDLDLSLVKGPIVDDATERTYISYNDGSAAPRASDISGEASPYASRQLGVPAPAKPNVLLNSVPQLVLADAQAWATQVLIPAIVAAFDSYLDVALPNARTYGGASTAGITSIPSPFQIPTYPTSQRGKVEPWNVLLAVPQATADKAGLTDGRLGGISPGDGYHWLACNAFPFWGKVRDTSGFTTAIGNILDPTKQDGTKLWSGTALSGPNGVVAGLLAFFDPTDKETMALRAKLDQAFVDFFTAAYYAIHSWDSAPATAGTEPLLTDSAYVGWVKELRSSGTDNGPTYVEYRNSQYLAWESAHATWESHNTDYVAFKAAADSDNAKRISAMATAQATMDDVSHQLDLLYFNRKKGLTDKLVTNIGIMGLVKSDANPNGLIHVDPDRVIEERFYAATWWTDWGEESAPSEVSALLEPDQNDTVIIERPAIVPSGRGITHWRLYRSNTGNNTTDFQLVAKIAIDATTVRSGSTINGYTDSILSADLKPELCKTATWAEPPVRPTTPGIVNTNPYMRGLAAGPNGVMAGFLDNFVAFCEPFIPYAWPAAYQQPLDFPVVGVMAFGSSWFVGTQGNPYVIYGNDPGSYVPLKINRNQPCVSRRSMVASKEGVFYASPDGYCLANQAGVQVITQGLFAREDWQLLNPASIFAVIHDNTLYFWYSGGGGGCYGLDTETGKLTRHDIQATVVADDVVTDAVYAANGGTVYKLFSGTRKTGKWRSANIVLPRYTPFAWLQVWGDQSPGTPATIRWYSGSTLIHTATITSNLPARLPPGRYREHTIEVESAARITEVAMASSLQELQAS